MESSFTHRSSRKPTSDRHEATGRAAISRDKQRPPAGSGPSKSRSRTERARQSDLPDSRSSPSSALRTSRDHTSRRATKPKEEEEWIAVGRGGKRLPDSISTSNYRPRSQKAHTAELPVDARTYDPQIITRLKERGKALSDSRSKPLTFHQRAFDADLPSEKSCSESEFSDDTSDDGDLSDALSYGSNVVPDDEASDVDA